MRSGKNGKINSAPLILMELRCVQLSSVPTKQQMKLKYVLLYNITI